MQSDPSSCILFTLTALTEVAVISIQLLLLQSVEAQQTICVLHLTDQRFLGKAFQLILYLILNYMKLLNEYSVRHLLLFGFKGSPGK